MNSLYEIAAPLLPRLLEHVKDDTGIINRMFSTCKTLRDYFDKSSPDIENLIETIALGFPVNTIPETIVLHGVNFEIIRFPGMTNVHMREYEFGKITYEYGHFNCCDMSPGVVFHPDDTLIYPYYIYIYKKLFRNYREFVENNKSLTYYFYIQLLDDLSVRKDAIGMYWTIDYDDYGYEIKEPASPSEIEYYEEIFADFIDIMEKL